MSNNNNPILRALSRVRERDQELKEQGYETPRDHYKRQVQETQNAREQQKLYNQLGRRTPYEDEDYKSALTTGIGSVPSKLANISGNLANLYEDFDRSSAGLFRSLDDNQKGVYDKYKSLINTKRSISDLTKKREEAWKYNDHQEAAALDQQIMELTKQEQSLRLTKDEEIILGSEVMYDTEDKLKNSSFLGGVNITGAKGSGKNVRDAVFNRIGLEDYRESYDNDNTAALNDIMGELFNDGKPTGLEWGKNYVNDQNVQRDRAAIDDPDDGFLTSLGKSFQVIGDNPAEAATVIGEAVPYLAGPWIGGLTSVADTAGSVGSAADKLRKKRGTDFLDKSDQYRLAAAGTGILASNYISMSVFGNALKGNTIGNRLVGSVSDGLIKKTGSDLSASVPLGVTRSLGGKATDMVAEGGQEMFQTALEAFAADEKVTKQDLAWAGALGMTAAGGFAAPGLASDALRGSAGIYDNVANGNQRLEEIITNDESLDVNNKYYDPSRVINRTVNEASAENATEEQLNKSFNTITEIHNNLQGQVKELREQRARQEQASQLMQELRDTTIPEDTRAEKTQQLQEVMAQIAEGPSDEAMDSLSKVEEALEKTEAAFVRGYRQLDEIRANRGFGEFKGAGSQAEVDADGNPIPKMKQFVVDPKNTAQSLKSFKEDLSVADTDAEIDAAVQASDTATTELQGKVEAYKESDKLLTSIEDRMATLSKQIESRDVAIKQAKDEEGAATLRSVQDQARAELQELLERRSAIVEQRTEEESLDTSSFEKELEQATKEAEAIKQKAIKLKEQRRAKIEKLAARKNQLEGKTDARSVKEYERVSDELSELTEGRLNNKQRQIRQAKRENDKAKQQQEVYKRAEERLKQLETREAEITEQIASEKQGRNDSTTISLLNNELKEVQGRIKTFKDRLGKTSKTAVDNKVSSSQQKLDKLLGKKKPKPKAKSKKTDSEQTLATVEQLKEDLKERQELLATTRDKMDEAEEGSDTYKALDKFAKQLEKDIDEINTNIRNLEGVKTKKTKVSSTGEVTTEVSRDEDTLTRKLRNFFNNADMDGNLEIELTPEKMASLLDIARQLDELRLKENELKGSGDVNDNILNGDKKQNWLGLRDYEAALALAIESGDISTFNRYIGHLQVFMDDHTNKAKALEKAYELQKTEGPQVVYRVKDSRTKWAVRNASTLEATGLPQKLRATGSILVKPNTKKLATTVRNEANMISEKYNVLKDLQKELTEQNTGSNRGKKLLTTKKTNSGQGLVNSFIKRSKDKAANYTAKKSGEFADISYVYEDGVEYAKFNQLLWGRHFRNSTKTNERPKGLSYDPVVKEMHAIGALATKSIAFGSTTQFAGDIDYTQPYTNMEALDKVYQDQWLKDKKAKAGYADWEAVFHEEFAGHNNSKLVYGQDYTADDVVAIIRNEMSDKDAINEARNAEIDAAIAAGATIILPRQFKGSKEADTKHNELIKYLADRGYELQDSKDSLSIDIAGKPVKVNTFKKTGEATITPTSTETEGVDSSSNTSINEFVNLFDTQEVYEKWSNIRDGSDLKAMQDQILYAANTYAPLITEDNKEEVMKELLKFKWFKSVDAETREKALDILANSEKLTDKDQSESTETETETETDTQTNNEKNVTGSTKDNPLQVFVDGSDIKGTGAIGFGVYLNHGNNDYSISGAFDTNNMSAFEKDLGIKLSKAPSNGVMEFYGALVAIRNTPTNEFVTINQDLEGSQLWILSGLLEHLSGQQFNTKAAYASWYKKQSPEQQKALAEQVANIIGLDPNLLEKKIFKGETASKGYYAADPAVRAIQQKIIPEILARQGKLTYKWVKGHSGIEGNERVDAIAKDRNDYNTYKDLFSAKNNQSPNKQVTYARSAPKGAVGFEVSTKGNELGKQFSALNASFKPGTIILGVDVGNHTIEEVYQTLLKEGTLRKFPKGTKKQQGKFKPEGFLNAPDNITTKEALEDYSYVNGYLPLWQVWSAQNVDLMKELRNETNQGKVLTDTFANTKVSQARALADILNGNWKVDKSFIANGNTDKDNTSDPENVADAESLQLVRDLVGTAQNDFTVEEVSKYLGIGFNRAERALDQLVSEGVITQVQAKTQKQPAVYRLVGNNNNSNSNTNTNTNTFTQTGKPTTTAPLYERTWFYNPEGLTLAIKEDEWVHHPVEAIETNVAEAEGKLEVSEEFVVQKDTRLNSQKDFFSKYIANKDYEAIAKMLGFELTEANKRQVDAFIRLHNRISERASEALKVKAIEGIGSLSGHPLYNLLVKTRPKLDVNGQQIVNKKGVPQEESYIEENTVTALALGAFQYIQTGGRNPYLDQDQVREVHGLDEYTQLDKRTQSIVSKWGSQRGFVFQELGKGAIRALGLRVGPNSEYRTMNRLESEMGALTYYILNEKTNTPFFIEKLSNEVTDDKGNPGLLTNGERVRTIVSGMSKGRAINFLQDLGKDKFDPNTGEPLFSPTDIDAFKKAKNVGEIVNLLRENKNGYFYTTVHLVRPAISQVWDPKAKTSTGFYNPDILDIIESSKKEKGDKDLLNELFDSAYEREAPMDEMPETFDQQTVIKGTTKVPRNQQEALLKISQQEWGVETSKADMMINLYDTNRDQFYMLLGVNTDEQIAAMHPSDREAALTDRRIAMDLFEKQIAWLKGRKDDKAGTFAGYFQRPVVWVNQRVGYASTLWNAQTNMFARMLSNLKAWATDIDINEDIIPEQASDITLHGRFFLMLAENMEGASNHMDFGDMEYNGVTYPKKRYRKSARTVDKVLPQDFLPRFLNYLETSPVIADAISAINSLNDNGSMTDSEAAAVTKAVAELDQGELSLGALMEYAAYLRAKEEGSATYSTTMGSQSDGITNGPMITKFLLAVASPAIRLMGGIIGKQDVAEGIIDFFETKARGNQDLYENTGYSMQNSLAEYVPTGTLLSRTVATVGLIDDDFGSRSWAKKLLTPFNYGSGLAKLRQAINDNVVAKFEREFKDIYAENTTKADRGKALTAFNKKLASIVNEYNDIFVHRAINEGNLEAELEKLVAIHNGTRATEKQIEPTLTTEEKTDRFRELYNVKEDQKDMDVLNWLSFKVLRGGNSNIATKAITLNDIEQDLSKEYLHAVDSLSNITYGTAAIRAIEKDEALYIKKRDQLTAMAGLAFSNYSDLRILYIREFAADPNNITRAELDKIERELAKSKAAVASAMSNLNLDENGRRSQTISSGIDLEKTTFKTVTNLSVPFNTLNRQRNEEATKSYGFGFSYSVMGDPGVRTLALMIQSLDAATSIQALAAVAGMNFHDANVFGLKDLAKGVAAQNKSFYQTITKYEPSIEIAKAVLRPVYRARELYRDPKSSPNLKKGAEQLIARMASQRNAVIEMLHTVYDTEMHKLQQTSSNDQYIHQYGGLGGVHEITEEEKQAVLKRYHELSAERDRAIQDFIELIEDYKTEEDVVEEDVINEEVEDPSSTETIVAQMQQLDEGQKRELINKALTSGSVNVRDMIGLLKNLVPDLPNLPNNFSGLMKTLDALNDETLGNIKVEFTKGDKEAEVHGYDVTQIRFSPFSKKIIIPIASLNSINFDADGNSILEEATKEETVSLIPLEAIVKELAVATFHTNMQFIKTGTLKNPELSKTFQELRSIAKTLTITGSYKRYFDMDNEADVRAFKLLQNLFAKNFNTSPEELIYLALYNAEVRDALSRIPFKGPADSFRNKSLLSSIKSLFKRVISRGNLNLSEGSATLADIVVGAGELLIGAITEKRLGNSTNKPMTVNGLIQDAFSTHEAEWTPMDVFDLTSYVDGRLMLELHKLKNAHDNNAIPLTELIHVLKRALLSYNPPNTGADHAGYTSTLLPMLTILERHLKATNGKTMFVLAENAEDFASSTLSENRAMKQATAKGTIAYWGPNNHGAFDGTIVIHTSNIANGAVSATTLVHELFHSLTSPALSNWLPDNAPEKMKKKHEFIKNFKLDVHALREATVDKINQMYRDGELTDNQMTRIDYALSGDAYYTKVFKTVDGQPLAYFEPTGIEDHVNHPMSAQYDDAPKVDEFLAELSSNALLQDIVKQVTTDMNKRKKSGKQFPELEQYYRDTLRALGIEDTTGKYTLAAGNAYRNFGIMFAELSAILTDNNFEEDVVHPNALKPYSNTFEGFNTGLMHLLPAEQAKSIANNFSQFLDGVVVPFLKGQAQDVIEAGEAIGVTPSDPNDMEHIPAEVLQSWEDLVTRLSVVVDMFSSEQGAIAKLTSEIEVMLKQFRKSYPNYLEQLSELSLINVDSSILNAKERAHKDNGIKKAKEYGIIEEETDSDQMTPKERKRAIRDLYRDLENLSSQYSFGIGGPGLDKIKSKISEVLNNLRTNYPNEYLPISYNDSTKVFTNTPYDLLNEKERRIQAVQRAYFADRHGFKLDSDNLSEVLNKDRIPTQHWIPDSDIKKLYELHQDIQQDYSDSWDTYTPTIDAKVKELLHLINHSMTTKGPYLLLVPAKVFFLMPYKYLNEEQRLHARAARDVQVLNAFKENPTKHLAEVRKVPGYLSFISFYSIKELDKSLLTQAELEFAEAFDDIPYYVTPELQLAVDTASDIINHSNMDDNLDIDEDAGGAVRDEERFSPVQIADFLGGIVGNKNGYLDAVIRNVVNPLMDKIPASLVEGYDHTKVWHDAIISGNAVYTTRALDAGFELDDQQAYVLEVLEVALLNTLNDVSNTTVFRQLQRSYDQAKSKVKVEDFHNGPWSETTQEERDIAYAKYNLVFRPGVGGTTDGTSDYLSNFAALALVSPEMQRVLSFSNPRSTRPEETSWFENLVSLYDRVVDYWNDKSTDLNPNDTVNNRVRDLTTALAAIYYKNHDKVVDANRSKFLDIEENLAKVGDGIILKMRQAGIRVLSVPALRDKNASKVGVKYLQGKFENFDKYVNYLFDYIHPNTPLGDVRETFNEIAGTLSEPEHLNARQVFGATKAIEAERGAIIEDVGKAMINQFNKANRDLTKEENKGITNTLLRPDLHVLLDRLGFSGITNLIKDREALNNEIRVIEDALATHPQGNEYIYRARALGKYMVTRQSSNGMLAKNAYAIAERVGTGQTASYSPEVLQQIDELVSLYALRNTKQSDKNAFATVLEREAGNPNEVNGLEYLLMSHAESSHESDALFEDNPYSRVKGHVPTILNPQKGFKVVNESEVADYESLGYVRASSLNQGPLQDLRGNKVLMTISNTGKQKYVSGAISIEETNKSGTVVVRRGDPEFNRLVREAQRDVHRAGNTFFNEQGSQGSETNLVPSYDQDGNIISFSYEMSSAGLDTYLDRYNNPVTLLSQYKGSNLGKKNFPLQNKRIVDFAIDQFANADERDKRKFVKVSPDSDNPKARAYWNSLPRETQMYIESRNGGSFLYMRNDELNMMFGFRKFNPGNAFDKDAMDRNILEAMYVGLFELPFGSKAKLRHDQTYTLWVDIIKKLKDFIVIRNFKVLFANIKSNVAFLMLNASDPINAYKDIKDALTYSLVYQKDMQELNKIKHELKIGLSNPDKVARYTVLRDKIARNPLRDFIEAGMMPMIVNDMSFKQGEVEYETALDKGINTVFGKLPTPLRSSAEFLLVSPGTPLYSFLSNATQQSDFVFKYALYKQELRKGKSRQQAMDAAREVFIDYDIPTNRAIQFMNDIGLWMFTKFALRIQRVLMRYAREKPGKLAVEHIVSTELLGNPSLISLNLANYFMGGSNPFRVPTDGVLTMWGNATPIQAIYAVAR